MSEITAPVGELRDHILTDAFVTARTNLSEEGIEVLEELARWNVETINIQEVYRFVSKESRQDLTDKDIVILHAYMFLSITIDHEMVEHWKAEYGDGYSEEEEE